MLAAATPEHGGDCPKIFKLVRGNRMAKATLENAIWDLEAQREGISLSQLLGGVRDVIPCGVSLGIQAFDSGADGCDRAGTGGGVSAHQAEVQAGLGY
jgi:L-alanine-DL-glutamate epimerase-like enolase superfamily enzyme